jgi:transposase
MKKRRKYDREFKQMAVELSKHRDNIRALAEELEIKPYLLYRWRRESLEYQGESFPGQGNPKQTEQEKEIARLKKELRETQLERDILKKAVSIFSKSDGKYSNS